MNLINKSILIVLPGNDFSEEEFLSVKFGLVRNNYSIFIASDAHTLSLGENGLKIRADVSFFNMNENNFAGIVFIGGKGVRKYWDNKNLHKIASKFYSTEKPVAAICSAPIILARAGILKEKNATCYPEDKMQLEKEGVKYEDLPLIISKNIITARDADAASDFVNAFIEQLSYKPFIHFEAHYTFLNFQIKQIS